MEIIVIVIVILGIGFIKSLSNKNNRFHNRSDYHTDTDINLFDNSNNHHQNHLHESFDTNDSNCDYNDTGDFCDCDSSDCGCGDSGSSDCGSSDCGPCD